MKQKAFTLIELLFTLALVGIVLSLGMLVVSFLGQLHQRYEVRVGDTYEISQVRQVLQADLKQTYELKMKDLTIQCLDDQQVSTTWYQWQDSLVIRFSANQVDTLAGKWTWPPTQATHSLYWQHHPSQLPLHLRLTPTPNVIRP